MLDSLKSGFGAGAKGQKHAEELQSLIATARQEREALGALLTQISGRGSKLAQMDKSLDQVSLKADAGDDVDKGPLEEDCGAGRTAEGVRWRGYTNRDADGAGRGRAEADRQAHRS